MFDRGPQGRLQSWFCHAIARYTFNCSLDCYPVWKVLVVLNVSLWSTVLIFSSASSLNVPGMYQYWSDRQSQQFSSHAWRSPSVRNSCHPPPFTEERPSELETRLEILHSQLNRCICYHSPFDLCYFWEKDTRSDSDFGSNVALPKFPQSMNFLSYLKISDELTFTSPKNLENFIFHVYISNVTSLAVSNRTNGLAKESWRNPEHYISTLEQLTYL